MRVDAAGGGARPARRRGPRAEVHLHDPVVPEPGRGDDVAGAPPPAGRGGRASASCSCSRTTRTGCCATRATRCRRCTRSTAASTSSTSGRSRRSSRRGCALGWTAAPRPVLEKMNLGKAGVDLCPSSLVAALRGRLLRRARLARATCGTLDRALPAPARHDARRARRALPARGDLDAARGRAVHLGDAARLHRHHRPAGAGAARGDVAFVPGRAAYLDGRGGSSMRLNFSGVGEDDIREGVRRIGKVISEQVGLYGTLTGAEPAKPKPAGATRPPLPPPSRRTSCRCAGARSEPGRAPQGRALAGAQRLAALGGPGPGRAGAAGPRGGGDRRRPRPRRAARGGAAPTWRSSRSTAAAARTARCRSCSSSSACPTPAPGRPRASAAWTRCVAKHAMRDAGIPTPDFYAFSRDRVPRPRRGQGAARDRGAARLPDRGQAGRPGLGARDQVRARAPPTSPAR